MKFIAILTYAVGILPTTLAFCCGNDFGTCADGTDSTPCCATGRCNIFCCHCDGHCRGGNRFAVDNHDTDIDETSTAFAKADTNGRGSITIDEYLAYMGVQGQPQIWVNWFNKHDKDQNGFVTADEAAVGDA